MKRKEKEEEEEKTLSNFGSISSLKEKQKKANPSAIVWSFLISKP